jgi:hypothetical protein
VQRSRRSLVALLGVVALFNVFVCGCRRRQPETASLPEVGPAPTRRIALKQYGLPADFFRPGEDTRCSNRIISYRFVVWMNNQDVAVGFNTSPHCRQTPDGPVDGVLRVVVFDVSGNQKASRHLPYLADGNGELVADGEGLPGPDGTLLIRLQSVNLDPEGAHESKSGVRLLDVNLEDVAQIDRFLEQTTLTDHALVFQEGVVFAGPRTYDVLDGVPLKQISRREVAWPTGAMDRKFGEHGFAFMLCSQELRPGKYTTTNVVHEGANFHCSVNALGEDGSNWEHQLPVGDTAALVGLLRGGGVVGLVHRKSNDAEELVEWSKGGDSRVLPWLPKGFDGSVDGVSRDFARYGSLATSDSQPCNALTRILSKCDESGESRWFIFDRGSHSALVDRAFPRNARAAISPDGLHYASFEADELRIYTLPVRD